MLILKRAGDSYATVSGSDRSFLDRSRRSCVFAVRRFLIWEIERFYREIGRMASLRKGVNFLVTALVVSAFLIVVLPEPAYARSMSLLSRHRRVSDQRLAEIETLLALEKMKGRVVTVPVAFGVLDPDKIGRRRRSVTDDRMSMLQRILQILANNPELISRENEKIVSWRAKEEEDRQADSGEYQLV